MFYATLKVTIHCWDMFFQRNHKSTWPCAKGINTLIWWEYSLSSFVGAKSCYSLACQETHYTSVLNLKVLKMYAKFCVSCHVLLRRGYLEGTLCLTSGPGSSINGIFQARILDCVAISPTRGSSWPRDQTHISCVSCIGRGVLYHWASGKPQHL